MKSELEALGKSFTDYVKGLNDSYSTAIDDLKSLTDKMDKYKSLIELAGGANDYETKETIYASQKRIQEAQMKLLQEQKKDLLAEREELNKLLATADGIYKD